ncbi:hypothetical protein NG895_11855 [Aeoliella sp. ICT_H6.2]|uniref:Uncharacterized protein n=1 Tax=Aeoliella straminimaris TaxID=2954799 RepID=A0A9X2FAK9_9BACT|nr:hypothetical protein [Aeoliella straminimaris]MCO6044602.1 hypothetical protein [Aeoliella straminimaris]
MSYQHTQHGYFHLLMYPLAAAMLVAAWWTRAEMAPTLILGLASLLFVLVGFCFQTLTTVDLGDRLELRFGPLPMFRKSIPYADIQTAEAGKSLWIDGWGIHWVPGRGWTYNLWGFDCAVLRVDGRTVRIGTDDPEGLVTFLRERIGRP